jgi:pilus assembly protein Flp/PilA
MEIIKKSVIGFIKNEQAATAIEYGLLAALIAIVLILALILIGLRLRDIFIVFQNPF